MLNILKNFNKKTLLLLFILNLSLVTNIFSMDLTSLTCPNEMVWGNPEVNFGNIGLDYDPSVDDSGMSFLTMAGLTLGASALCATGICLRSLSNALDDRAGSLPEEFEREEFPGQDELEDKNLKSLDDNVLILGTPKIEPRKKKYTTFIPIDLAKSKEYEDSPRLVTKLVLEKPANIDLKDRDTDLSLATIRKNPLTALGFLRDQKIKQRCIVHGINFRDCTTCNDSL